MTLQSHKVLCARAPRADYSLCEGLRAPELPEGIAPTTALACVRNLLFYSGLDAQRFGTPEWNPLGELIQPGDKVLIKPNWVYHHNRSGAGMDSLITHPSVIEAVLHYAIKARPSQIVIGDAPIQGCDFESLRTDCRLDEMARRAEDQGVPTVIKDLRLSARAEGGFAGRVVETSRSVEDYVRFDLGTHSSLEPITDEQGRFRVTMYDPEALKRTHAQGKHEYLIAREAIEADVIINLPKLKTHKKSCLTGALKNMVGINGHKDYLPHHRQGGILAGGDCYRGKSRLKSLAESLLDRAECTRIALLRNLLAKGAILTIKLATWFGQDSNVEGSWYGNDTIWRTCLDLQRVLHYGRTDGSLSCQPQRRVITFTDAIVAGEGNGPLSPDPVALGVMTLGLNTSAVEWVHALLMGFDPNKIALVREAFTAHRYPLATFRPERIRIEAEGSKITPFNLISDFGHSFRAPEGWLGYCELTSYRYEETTCSTPRYGMHTIQARD